MSDASFRRPRAIFIDRDGTVSEEIGYMTDPSHYMVFPWTGQAIRKINDSGLKAILVTNQSGVGRGYFPENLVHGIHEILKDELSRAHATLDAVYFCPHHPDAGCDCRKPAPGMLFRARDELSIDLEHSYMIGDRYLDILTARAAGTHAVLVLSGDGSAQYAQHDRWDIQPDLVAENLLDAVERILGQAPPPSSDEQGA